MLVRVWGFSGDHGGKYLVVSLPLLLDSAQAHGTLVQGRGGYSQDVRAELITVPTAATGT